MTTTNPVTKDPQHYKIAIIGAGPIGIELAVALKQAGRNSLIHFEAGQIGSTINWWAPGTQFFSSPERIELAGVPLPTTNQEKATREQYLAYLRAVVHQFQIPIKTYTRVTSLTRNSQNQFEIQTRKSLQGVGAPAESSLEKNTLDSAQPSTCTAENIILAIGNMHQPRLLNVPGESLPHVSHYLGEIHQYFNRNVTIVGGKNSAVEAAIRLYRAGANVTIVYRGAEFDPKRVKYWLKPEIDWLISKNRIQYFPQSSVTEINSDSVIIQSTESKDTSTAAIPTDTLLLLTGYLQDNTLFQQLGVEMKGNGDSPTFDCTTMQTNIPNVYIAGTAAGGSQARARFYIENTHIHVKRILKTITGQDLAWRLDADFAALEES